MSLAATAATLLLSFLFFAAAAAAPASAQPATPTIPQPPAWIYNKTEWKSRLYNSLRLTPAQVGALETVLDARDTAKAPLQNATWNLARAASAAGRAKLRQRNATLLRTELVNPLLAFENATVVALTRAKESALNATEIKLRAAASGAASAGASDAAGVFPPATFAAALIAQVFNLTADAVDRHLQDMLTIDQYRAAARRSKVQAAALASPEAQAEFATLGSFGESAAPVTTTPVPISAPAGSAAAASSSTPLSPEDAAAAAAFLEAAAALPKPLLDPVTSTTPVRDAGDGSSASASASDAAPLASVFAQMKMAPASSSSSSSAPISPHPASLVDASDADIASWLSERPSEADSADEREHLSKLAAWVAAAEELSLGDDDDFDEKVHAAEVSAYAAEAESALAGVASSDAAPEGGVTSPEVSMEAAAASEEVEEEAKPVLLLPSRLSASAAAAFYRIQYPNGTVARSTPGGLAPDEGPPVAVGAPTYPATSLDAMAIQAEVCFLFFVFFRPRPPFSGLSSSFFFHSHPSSSSSHRVPSLPPSLPPCTPPITTSNPQPAIKDYYRYLALRVMGFPKTLSATAVAATAGRSLKVALSYCLTSLKIDLADGASPVWVGQSA